jgi:hypothetical protein
VILRCDVVSVADVVVATAGSASDVVVMVCDEDGMFCATILSCCVVRGLGGRDKLVGDIFFLA